MPLSHLLSYLGVVQPPLNGTLVNRRRLDCVEGIAHPPDISILSLVLLILGPPSLMIPMIMVCMPPKKVPTPIPISNARQVGISKLVIFINKVDQVDNQEMLDVVKMEMRELLNEYKFDGDNMPIVMGSALAALEGRKCIHRPHFQPGE